MSDDTMLVKVVIVGDASVGKSCLVLRYSEDRFVQSYLTTMGSDFAVKLAKVKSDELAKEKDVRLAIWDLGGQEMFQAMRKYYLQGAAGAAIVFDVTSKNSFDHIADWKKEIEFHCGKIPCMLLANKIDLKERRVISTEEANALARKMGCPCFETSAKSGENVHIAFNALAQEIYHFYKRKR